jgi:excinuclease ABC subunit A
MMVYHGPVNTSSAAVPSDTRPARPVVVEAKESGPRRSTAHDAREIRVRGAREHNLKNIDVTIPRDQLVVITGLSGSGKSSLAFDTIFAEGQRKYMESLSAYARQFLDQLKKPDVDEIEGIPPTIAIEQRSAAHNPRSTVATTTEIYDYLRLLYARCGTPYSWAPTKTKKDGTVLERAGIPISATSSTQIVDTIMTWTAGTKMMVLAPVVRGQKGFHRDVLDNLTKQGWARARVNGTVIELREALKEPGENPLKLGRYEKHTIEAVIDRLVLSSDGRQRLAESIENALRIGDSAAIIAVEESPGTWTDRAFSAKFADPERPEYSLEEVSPRLFSFNSPFGACPTCHGLGSLLEIDPALVVPDPTLGVGEGAIAPWKMNAPGGMFFRKRLRYFIKVFGLTPSTPFAKLPADVARVLVYGLKDADREKLGLSAKVEFEGVIPSLQAWFEKTDSTWIKEWLHTYMGEKSCATCNGDRLRIEALHVLLDSSHAADAEKATSTTVIGRPKGAKPGTRLNIAEYARLTITDAAAYISGLKLTTEQATIAEPILKEIHNRLRFLMSVGLEYLSLDRRTSTLSGGEAQRIRLATQVGSGLVGACYVLDEPTIGLHQRDNDRLITTLRRLCDIGNSVLVVEHDEDMIRAADHVLDIGPGPGVHGGRVVAQGTVPEICATPGSLTGDYLSGRRRIELPTKRRPLSDKKSIVVKGARQNNLKNVDVAFPLGGIVCVTGVSGSGKSTLVNDILLAALRQHLNNTREAPGAHKTITGLNHIDRIIEVDQSPIGRTPRSNPATYTGIWDEIRKILGETKEAKIRGYKIGRFSFNVTAQNGGGRCEACQGQGLKKIEMHFLPDVFVQCEVCRGKRYNRETLEVHYRGKSISDILDMTVENALSFFENHKKIERFLKCLHDVGLDYITLGQPSTTLSGGEAQRIKLATELGKSGSAFTGEMGGAALRESGPSEDGEQPSEPAPISKAARRSRVNQANAHTLYILDEPTTGLHFEDIRKLIEVFNKLADAGNSLVIIEHNLDVIKCADWLIDLGPEGGAKGGTLLATGTPEAVAKVGASYTGQYLKGLLKK